MNRRTFTTSLVLAAWQTARAAKGSPKDPDAQRRPSMGLPNVATPTLGGMQFWGDELFFHQWRIQRNVFTGHCRLLDADLRRQAWGTFAQCQAKLDEIKRARKLPAMEGPCVIVLHGLCRTAVSMDKMSGFLRQHGHYNVFNVNYPSTRGTIGEHAEKLASVIAHLDGINEINFVAHSLGNLVIRHYLADQTDDKLGKTPDPRIKRIVMLGPPNNGARLAELLLSNSVSKLVVGRSGSQIARWSDLEPHLATPECQFAIIAGGRGEPRGYNPLLGGDNDLIVSVESTRLPGACDFAVLPVWHTLMMDDAVVQDYTLRFLRSGWLVADDKRVPIQRVATEAAAGDLREPAPTKE